MHFIEEFTNMIFLEDQPEKSDIIFIPGSGHAALAHTAARLYHSGLAPLILPSGKYSKLTPALLRTAPDPRPSLGAVKCTGGSLGSAL